MVMGGADLLRSFILEEADLLDVLPQGVFMGKGNLLGRWCRHLISNMTLLLYNCSVVKSDDLYSCPHEHPSKVLALKLSTVAK